MKIHKAAQNNSLHLTEIIRIKHRKAFYKHQWHHRKNTERTANLNNQHEQTTKQHQQRGNTEQKRQEN